MNAFVKKTVLAGMKACGVFALRRKKTSNTLRILAYHGVDVEKPGINDDGFMVPPEVFADQLKHVAKYFTPVSLDEVVSSVRNNKPWSENAVLVTFDDGYLNNVEVAAPILAKLGMSAVFFVTTGFIDGVCQPWWYVLRNWIVKAGASHVGEPPGFTGVKAESTVESIVHWEHYLKGLTAADRNREIDELGVRLNLAADSIYPFMSWDQLRSLKEMGHAVAPHTVSHINLGAETQRVVVSEVEASIQRIEEELGVKPLAYSYPYGRGSDIQPAVLSVLKDQGVEVGVTTVHGFNVQETDSLLLKRLNVTGGHVGLAFEKLMSMG